MDSEQDGHGPSRAALVTGASSGIGRSMAAMLCDEGYAVTLVARTPAKLDQLAESLAAADHRVQPVVADVSSEDDIRAAVQAHQARYGRMDVLVNNAGLGIRSPFAQSTTKQIDLQLSVNLRGVILFARESLQYLAKGGAEHGQSWIVNTASAAGKSAIPELASYSAAKHGVVGLSEALNRELVGLGVKSCVLCPGYVDTPLADHMRDSLPGDHMIQPTDLAEALRFLLRLSRHCVVPEITLLRPGLVP